MNRKISSVIVILSTIVSVSIMIYNYNVRTNVINGFRKIDMSKQEANYGDNNYTSDNKNEVKNIEVSNEKSYVINNNSSNDYKEIESEENTLYDVEVQDYGNDINGDARFEDIDREYYERNYNNSLGSEAIYTSNNVNKNSKAYSVNNNYYNKSSSTVNSNKLITVFKINKRIIPNKISNSDKFKLLGMAKSLSIKDYKQLSEDIKRSDELPAAVDIFSLLQNKLSNDDYTELKEILDPYLNFDLIEDTIENK